MLHFGTNLLLFSVIVLELICASHSIYARKQIIPDDIDIDNLQLSYRLPNNTKPETYDISLQTWIHLGNFSFTGKVKIGIVTIVENPGFNITLHQRQLTILNVKLIVADSSNENVPLDDWLFINEREFLVIPTKVELKSNSRYILEIEYKGIIRNDMGGFYRSSYFDDNGKQKWLATTQFQTTNARHGFPCYDEPALKANYTIRITHDPSYTAISNMPQIDTSPVNNSDGTMTTEFRTTPPTSTYLIAFVVSDYQYRLSVSNAVSMKAWAKPTHLNETHLALETGEQILSAIANYVGVPFSLPKLDQIAIPDFAPGAMENWGLVTYREGLIYWNDQTSTYTMKTSIVSTIAHEFGHQWFGNLVTIRWWNWLWLNEGFATLFSYIGTDLIYPDWRYRDMMLLSLQNIMKSDEENNAAPMTDDISNPDGMTSEFSTVSYNKAGCVLRMFLYAFSENSFRKGLNYYLIERSYKDAAEEDLINALNKSIVEDNNLASNLNLTNIIKSWTNQRGFPVLRVDRNYRLGFIRLNQQRYMTDETTVDRSRWWIPFNFVTANKTEKLTTFADHWMPQYTSNIIVRQNDQSQWSSDDWIIFNINHTGYYRVQYDTRNYNLLANALLNKNYNEIPLLSRAQIIDDAFSFAKNNRLDYQIPLQLVKYLVKETEYIPWASAIKGLSFINRLFAGNESYPLFKDFLRNLTTPLFAYIGPDAQPGEPHQHKYLRTIALSIACSVGVELCLNKTTNLLESSIRNNKEIHQNIRSLTYCGGLRKGSDDTFYTVWKRFNQSNSGSYRDSLITALSCTSNDKLLYEFLASALPSFNKHFILYTDAEKSKIISAVSSTSQYGLNLTILFLHENIDETYEVFHSLKLILDDIAYQIVNKQMFNLYNNFTKALLSKGYINNETLQTVLEQYNKNRRWLDLHSDSIFYFVNGNTSGTIHLIPSNLTIFIIICILFYCK